MFDWTGDFNTYAVPFDFYDAPVVNRFYSARIAAFIRALAYAGGTDVTLTPYEPYDEPAIVPPGDPNFPDQGGPPRDPPGNVPGGPRDDFFSTEPRLRLLPAALPGAGRSGEPGQRRRVGVCDAQCLAYTGFDLARLLVRSAPAGGRPADGAAGEAADPAQVKARTALRPGSGPALRLWSRPLCGGEHSCAGGPCCGQPSCRGEPLVQPVALVRWWGRAPQKTGL